MATANVETTQNVFCDICEIKRSTKLCATCEMSYCHTCIKVHRKMKGSDDHDLRELSDNKDEGSQMNPGLPRCSVHTDTEIEFICTDCVYLACEKCKDTHSGHDIRSIGDGCSLFQSVCRKNAQQLFDSAHDLEEYKSLLLQKTNNYEEAIATLDKWENDLITKITECAKKLRDELRKLKDAFDDTKKTQHVNVDATLTEIDDEIASLNTRKTNEVLILSQKAASSQILVSKVGKLRHQLLMPLEIPSADELLPNQSKVESLIGDVEKLFCPLIYHMLNCIDKIQIPNAKSYSGHGYRFCKPVDNPNAIVLQANCKANIRFLDLNTRRMIEKTSTRSAYELITLNPEKFVAIHSTNSNVCLLDSKFQCLHTLDAIPGQSHQGLCPKSDGHFLVCHVTQNEPFRGVVEIMSVDANIMKLCNCCNNHSVFEIPLEEKIDAQMLLQNDKAHVSIFSGQCHTKLNLETGCYDKTDLSQHLCGIRCAVIDSNDNTLVGDDGGSIHLFDKSLKHIRVILQIGEMPTDIAIVDGKILVTTRDKVLVYS